LRLTYSSYNMPFILFILLFLICYTPGIAQNFDNIKDQKPVHLSSGLSLSSSIYHMKGDEYRQQPFNWFISGTPTLHLYGVAIPFSFYWSNQALSYQQPFNQFGLSPSWRWIRLHAGYSSVHFSDYTLAGRRFLGGGVELNPGKLRFGAVYGRFQQAVEQDSILRPTPGNFLSEIPNGAFDRRGYSVKLGYGTERNFFDLIFFQAADDTSSLFGPLSLETIVPEKNTAIGIKHRFTFFKKWFIEGDWAGSFYTRDRRYALADSAGLPEFVNTAFEPRLSSQLLYAGNSQFGYDGGRTRWSLRYRRIARDFKTMGAYYFQTDLEEWSTQLGLQLFKRRVLLRGTFGLQRDNLAGSRQQTTSRLISSAIAGWQITRRWRADVVYTNFGIQQRNTITGLLDSLRIDQVSSSVQVQTRYQLKSPALPQSVGLSLTSQSLAPRTRDLQFAVDTRSYQGNVFYTCQIPDYRLGLAGNIHGLRHIMESVTTTSAGIGGNLNMQTAKAKLSYFSGLQYYFNFFDEVRAGSTWSFNAGANYIIKNNWSLSLQLQHLRTLGGLNNREAKFQETFAQINTNFNF
jgi:hypothetical protein